MGEREQDMVNQLNAGVHANDVAAQYYLTNKRVYMIYKEQTGMNLSDARGHRLRQGQAELDATTYELVDDGLTNDDVAAMMGIQPSTIRERVLRHARINDLPDVSPRRKNARVRTATEALCSRCKKMLPLDQFGGVVSSGHRYVHSWCKACVAAKAREYKRMQRKALR